MQGSGNPLDRNFMFKRQLVGFYLMRYPVEALNRLASILYSGNFTKEEDKAWVEEHGPNNWTSLAGSLGRNYIHGPARVSSTGVSINLNS